jgi:alpha-1,3-glucan synthase
MLLASFLLLLAATIVSSLRFDAREVDYNLNQNQVATNPLDYSGKWDGHVYHPSPDNWRFPFYTLFLDRFVNGDPSNDNANGTVFEHDPNDTQMRHGGDVTGLLDTLDYIQGMGIKVSQARSISLNVGTKGHRASTSPAHHSSINLGNPMHTLRLT